MKELIKRTGMLLMILVAGLSVASCSDDDAPLGVSDNLVGTWAVVYSYSAEYENGNLQYESNNSEVGQVYVLNRNGSININGYDAGRWGASGSSFIIYWEEDGETYPEQYNMVMENMDRVTISYDITYNEDGSTWRDVYRITLQRQSSDADDDQPSINPQPGGDDNVPSTGNIPQTYPGTATGVSTNASNLVGSWRVTNGYSAYYVNGRLAEGEPYTPDSGLGATWTLNANGTYTTSDGGYGMWRLEGATVYVTMYDEGYETETIPFTLAQFTGNTAELRFDYSEVYDGMTAHSVESISFERL